MTTPPADGRPARAGAEDDATAVPDADADADANADADEAEPAVPARSTPPSDVVARTVPSSLRTFLT